LSSIAIKYTLIDIAVFDYIPFPIFTHTMGMTHFLGNLIRKKRKEKKRKEKKKKEEEDVQCHSF